jgi:formylglycine-generating enzyme required for sulfatase activity
MVHVEKGQFGMGCDVCQQHERPFHLIQLDGFWIDQYEVANTQYANFLNICLEKGWVNVVHIEGSSVDGYDQVEINGNRAIYLNPSISWAQITFNNNVFLPVAGKENYPVNVSWQGAQAYCELYKKRLPTEAEWEYSAKGGHLHQSNTDENSYFRYSGSNDANSVAWHLYNSGSSSHLVGGLSPNELNTFDMSGNLREWVSDWYDPNYYSNSPLENPQGPSEPVYIPELGKTAGKVMRGGSWRENLTEYYEDPNIESTIDNKHVRVTKRDYGCPCNLSDRTGFRCAAPEMTVTIYFLTKTFPKYIQPKNNTSYRWVEEEMGPVSMEDQNRNKIDTTKNSVR